MSKKPIFWQLDWASWPCNPTDNEKVNVGKKPAIKQPKVGEFPAEHC